MTNIISIHHVAGVTYQITFDQPVTAASTAEEDNFLLWSPGNNSWFPIDTSTQVSANVINVHESNGDADCTLGVLLQQPVRWTSGMSFATAIPVTPVT
jgi:hypothetical protein